MRRGSMRCPLRKRLVWCAVCCTPRFSRSSAASFCCALGPPADAFPWRDDLKPPRSLPSPLLLLPFAISPFHDVLELLSGGLAQRLVRRDYRLRRLSWIVGHEHEIQISLRDLAVAQDSSLQPAKQPRPVVATEENDGEPVDLSRLNECECLEQLIQRAEPAGEDNERHRVLDEHRLPHEEILEVDERVDVRVCALLERELDVAADRPASTESRALVSGFHGAGSGARDDVEAGHGQEARCFHRRFVVGIVGPYARRPEDRNRFLDRRERIESVDELPHDAQHTPRIGPREVGARSRLLQQLFVFSDGRRVANGVVDRARDDSQCSRALLRWWSSPRLEMPLLRPLLESLERLLFGGSHYFGIELLSSGGARPRRPHASVTRWDGVGFIFSILHCWPLPRARLLSS